MTNQKTGIIKDGLPIRMTSEDWIAAYEKEEIPHWAEDLTPSPLAKRLLDELPRRSGNRILEIGVGNSRDSIYFAQNGNNVVGVDVTPGAIKLAEKNRDHTGL